VKLPNGTPTYVRHEHVKVIEPEYEPGALYLDAEGNVWRREVHAKGWLYMPNFSGSSLSYPHNRPVRPLRKLVPEA
jgi:hypothetical protein